MPPSTTLRTTAFVGLFFVMVYIVLATGIVPVPDHLAMTLMFFIGPAAISGVLSIWRTVRDDDRMNGPLSAPMLTGTVFLVIAFALFNLMLVVQETVHAYFRELLAAATTDAVRENLRLAFRVVNPVQLGIDISFDIFYCLGILMVASVMYRARIFGRLIAAYGMITAAALLIFNLWTFPKPPASAGLIDLGPATALWWIAVIVQMLRASRHRPEAAAAVALP
jgi:hypothetical protein